MYIKKKQQQQQQQKKTTLMLQLAARPNYYYILQDNKLNDCNTVFNVAISEVTMATFTNYLNYVTATYMKVYILFCQQAF